MRPDLNHPKRICLPGLVLTRMFLIGFVNHFDPQCIPPPPPFLFLFFFLAKCRVDNRGWNNSFVAADYFPEGEKKPGKGKDFVNLVFPIPARK